MWPQNQKNSWNEKGIVWNIHSAFFIIIYYLKILKICIEYKIYLLISF